MVATGATGKKMLKIWNENPQQREKGIFDFEAEIHEKKIPPLGDLHCGLRQTWSKTLRYSDA